MATLRFHWDFFGPDARGTAEHFLEHVDEFCANEGITGHRHRVMELPGRATASLDWDEKHLALVRDRLRPKRAERFME